MDWTQIIVTVLGAIISALAGGLLKIKLNADQRAQLDAALQAGVAAAAERLKGSTGDEKHQLALRTAESLAPKAMGKLDEQQKSLLVDATYARLKPSLNTTWVSHGEALDHQVEQVTLPRPAPVPSSSGLPPVRRGVP